MAAFTVTVRLSGPLADSLGPRHALQLNEGATVYDLLEAVARKAEIDPGRADGLAAVAGGSFLARSQALADGDEVDVLVPVAGG